MTKHAAATAALFISALTVSRSSARYFAHSHAWRSLLLHYRVDVLIAEGKCD